ncbi:MAG: DUF1214 domain-containing protein [Alphaproteobacteria bacterium]|nr:DUF1214 domain-containing protein [Alphaproteobacteria bacterium]
MKLFLSIVGALLLGLLIGVGSAFQAISTGWGVDMLQNKGWRVHKNLSSPKLSVYAKAYLVNSGQLPLPQDQALYFFTYVDSAGQNLTANCRYTLEGDDMDAFWWSVSLHNTDFMPFENNAHRYSFNMSNIIRKNDGRYNIIISAEVSDGNWLPLNSVASLENTRFMMSFRMYGIDKKISENIGQLSLPTLLNKGCV